VGQHNRKDFFVNLIGSSLAFLKKRGDVYDIHQRTATCTLFLLALLGSTFAQHVQTDFDHQANFSQYKTYSWQEIKPPNSLWDARIKNAVDAQLSAKGWTQVASGGDVAVVAIKTSQTQRTLQTFYDSFGGGWGWRRFGGGRFGDSTTTEQDYKVGTLSTCTTPKLGS
jgi:hypothetical protein